jgi:ABC-2 type transport system permease protein
MRHVWTIARREVGATLHTTTGWLVLMGVQLIAGLLFLVRLDQYLVLMADQVGNPYAAYHMTLAEQLLAPWFGNLIVMLLLVCPALSMRLFAEEMRQHTLELLVTSPAPSWSIVLGKFLGVAGYLCLALGCTAWMPLTLLAWASPDPAAIVGGYLGMVLLGSAILAIGMLASSFTENQVVALVLGFAGTLCIWMVGWLDPDPTSWASQAALGSHVQDFLVGGFRLSDLAYYLLVIGWCLFATLQRVESYRYT